MWRAERFIPSFKVRHAAMPSISVAASMPHHAVFPQPYETLYITGLQQVTAEHPPEILMLNLARGAKYLDSEASVAM